MQIKSEYEELIAKLYEDANIRRKIKAVLAELDLARQQAKSTSFSK